jgi:hypothetical protein
MKRHIFQKAAVVCWISGAAVLVERLHSQYSSPSSVAGKETLGLLILAVTLLVVGSVFQYAGSPTVRTEDQEQKKDQEC